MTARCDPRPEATRPARARRSKAPAAIGAKPKRGVAAWLTAAVLALLGLCFLSKGLSPGHAPLRPNGHPAMASLARPLVAESQRQPNVRTLVPDPPDPFDDAEARAVIEPLVRAAIDFIRSWIASGQASYTGKAEFYVRRLNGTLEKIGISQLPKPI